MPVRHLANPFWSERLQEGELDLRLLRPANLPPVPGDDAEVGRELDGEMELPISDREGSRKEARGRLRSRDPGASRLMEEGFETPATPASWVRHGKDVTPKGQSGGEVGRRSEGEMPYVEEDQEQSLERALERELMSQLHGENQRLKKELEEMQLRQRVQSSRVTPSSWSAVTPDDDGGIPAPPPPRSRSPMPRNHDGRGDGLKYTPNGTRVPDGPPPGPSVLPDLPVWPFGNYETCEAWAPCLMSMGSCWKGPLQAGDQRGGMQSRQELQGGYKDLGHGVQSRQEHQDRFQGSRDGMDSRHGQGGCAGLPEGGIQSRHGVPHQDVMSAAQARAAWLERELKSLKEVLETDARNNGMQQSGYWSNPVWRWDQEDRGCDRAKQRDADLRHGRAQQRDADPREARALSNDGVCGDGRAPGVSQGEGQTTEVSHHGRDRGHQQLDGRDLCDPGERKGSAGPSNEKENEALRSSNPVLPILPAVSQKNSAVDAADWLVEIRPMIGDLSTSAADWWNSTMQSTLEVYKVWLASTPLERLRLKPPNPVDSTKFRNGHQIQRLEQRVTTILLPSIPLELRHDLISARQLWPSAILYRILRSYQPGGWGERSMLLTELTVTSAASSAIDASTRLRMWRRRRSRAIELGASLPDVLLQVRALDVIVQGVLKQHPQSQFRAIGLPVVRLHTDRAKEFVSRSLAQWMRDHDVLHTTSSGDESQGSARAEGEIGYLKSRVRLLINASKSPPHYWPLALRHAAEARYRQQMSQFGVPLPRLIPFGTQAMAKFKRWHHVKDKDTWEHPMQRVTVYGPAMDMSSSSRGYYIEANGRWMRSTVVLETKNPRGGALPVENLHRELQDQGEQLEDLAMDNGSEQYAPTTIAPEEDFEDILEGDEGRALPRIVHVDDQPHQGNIKRRLMGKQSPPAAYSQPLLRVLRSGGECTIQEVMDAMDFEDEKENHPEEEDFNWGENRSSTMQEWYEEEGWRWDQGHHRSMSDLHHSVQAVELLQQSEMRKLCKEEIGKMDQVTHGKIVLKLEGECEELEKRLMKMQMEEKEVFTSRTVPLEEVRQNLEEWIPSLQSEYQSLLTHEAIKPISQAEYQELHQEMEVTTIPGMVVSVVKPPYKLKSRFVACGNYVQIDPQQVPETAAGGLDAIVARVMVAMAARNEWAICPADVRTAFLQAERRPTPGKVTIVTPPGLLKETGILQKGAQERWLIQKAIYGLIESPKDWADHRDAILKKVKWIDQNTKKQKWIERTAENHLWQVKVKDQQEPEGFLGVYVDDLIAIGKDGLLDELMEQLTLVFKMAEPTKVTPEKGVTFCGYEIGMDENYNYTISQEKYVEELIKKHQMEGFEAQPLPKVTEAEDEDPIDKKTLRSAQTIAGELLWLMTRSRPDICYAVSLMTRLLHRRPSYVVELGRHVVRYLAESKSMGLKFESGKRGSEELLVKTVKTDTSFAPPVDGYRSVQGTAIFHGDHLLQWSSGRQAFVTLSTAEAELVGYVDGFQQGQSIDGLLKIFGFHTYKRLQGDCKAALAQINSDATAWRTRHLRLRASRLRELVLDRESSWEAEHIPGLELAPDGFTKVLVGQAFRRHREQLGMCNVEHFKEKIEVEEAQIRRLWHQEEVEETESLKLSQCLLGAGIAMVCTDHKVLGAMLLATAGLLSVKGRWEQENKRPARKVSRTQQELRERANTPNGSKDEAAHPPIEGITGMAHDVRGDLRDQSRIGANVGSQGFRASRMSSLFSCHGSEVEEQPTAEERLPRLCAFRAPGDPSRDQLPLRPPVDAARAKAREQARSLGTAHRELYRNFDIPQPHHDRQRAWWDDARFEAGPTGQDKWIQTRDGLLIRTHSKLRRRSFHPLHRSVPIEISGLRAERHTVIFADDPESLFVDPRPRFVESDEWSGNTTWTKDYRWRGYTVFVLRSCVADRHEQGQPDYVDPVLAAPKRASRPAGERLPDPRDDDRSGGAAPMFAAASSSSAGGYGSNQREREPAMVQVNVNVYNTSGIATPRAEAPEAEDSEFEFVTP